MVCPACKATNTGEQRFCSSCGAVLAQSPAIQNSDIGGEAGQATVVVRQRAPEDPEKTIVTPGHSQESVEPDADHTIVLNVPQATSAATQVADWATSVTSDSTGADAANLAPDSLLAGRYNIICRIGEGGMGAVYKARDLEVDRTVAIKVIRPELAADPEILQRFKQELVLARQVTHRNVARVFDLGAAGSLKFISMELIDGAELSDLVRKHGPLEPRRAAGIILQICQGLEAAHAEGVVHRDLKPQNVMIDHQDRVVVMDFGIADFVGAASAGRGSDGGGRANTGPTQAGLIGTPRYMSPEQAKGGAADARSDIFTLGLIFYELLTAQLPFQTRTVAESLRLRIAEGARAPVELNRHIPAPVNQLVMKCLERDPARRYASVTQIIQDLEVWLGIRSTVRAAQVKRMRWMAGALALLLAVASGFIVWNQIRAGANRPHSMVKLLVADFANRTGDRVLDGTLEPMLQVALERASFVSALNRGSAHSIEAELQPGKQQLDETAARLVALREGVGIVVSGAIEKHNSRYRLSAKAINTANGSTVSDSDTDVDAANELPQAVEKIGVRIRRALGDTSSNSRNAAEETFSSASLDAAQQYAHAQDLQWAGKWDDSIAAYHKAIEFDPNLSRAYSGLAATLANLGRRQESEKYYQLALAHIDRMSEREKYRTRGGYYLLTRDYQKAAEQFKSLVSQYPVDTAGLGNLALSYFYARNMTAALEGGQRVVDLYPDNLLQRNNLSLYAMYAGDFDRAIREATTIVNKNPKFEKAWLCLAMADLGKGDEAGALAAYNKMSSLSVWGSSEAALGLADLAIYRGRLSSADSILERGIEEDLEHKNTAAAATKMAALAGVQLNRHRNAAASAAALKALAASEDESIVYPAAVVLIETGGTAKAMAAAAKLESRFEPEPRATAKLIQAEALLEAGKFRDAVAAFQESQKLADSWLGRYGLGRAYLAAGLFPDADAELDVCLKRRGEATAVFLDDDPSFRYLPPVYYYQGRAREGLKSAGAAKSYKAFLDIKAGADEDALVADAMRRLK